MEGPMQTNTLPRYDDSVNPTGCCPRFDPTDWDGRTLVFEDKPFLRATTRSVMHIPVDMGRVFSRVQAKIEAEDAYDPDDYIVLSRDLSPWKGEHLFAVPRPVPGEEMVTLTGRYLTRVFEGPYRNAPHWIETLRDIAKAKGATRDETWVFYTTCPKCARAYGRNYVVGLVRID
ncbi:hydrolase [Jannaschia ovalis]|uniref:Uncharacterized protein n=1 Tax=Jannaschia ovalis TaxID=3038773 RepID=A0ABY8L9Z2_9RHOB|nr:hydrolase [Jannaschia sp. GRR-S6-38]WGH78126.1 hypothetical protein P8627_13975 [Jannaschia sp. GRR-S6-38]